MRELTKEEVQVLKRHEKWLNGQKGGERANLYGANLYGANLDGANLNGANLDGANLDGANLNRANLDGANLNRASLYGANLDGANLNGANLNRANLDGANLNRASLYGANLNRANLDGKFLQSRVWYVCPPSGSFEAWKSLKGGYIAYLEIPAFARRLTALGSRKCRAECAIVLGIYQMTKSGPKAVQKAQAKHDGRTVYQVGCQVWPDSFDDDPRIKCSHGIHFFMTRAEAESW